jgi:chemotaxis protein CheC
MPREYSELQLSALMEVANTGSGYAAADLSEMLGHSVNISVPRAIATSLNDAIDALGPADSPVTAVGVRVSGDMDAVLVSICLPELAEKLCGLLGLDSESDIGRSALAEMGNLLSCAYAGVISEMADMTFEVYPPDLTVDMLGAMVVSLAAIIHPESDTVLLIDSDLTIQDVDAGLSVLFVPASEGIEKLLTALGVG